MKGLYYFVKRIYQLSQSLPVFERLGGKIINILEFPTSYLYFSYKYGIKSTKLMLNNLRRLNDFARGVILCHSADDTVPYGGNYHRVFVYHGTSDKVFTLPDKKIDIKWFEYYFLTGLKDYYKLKKFSHNSDLLDSRVVKIGMFRSDPIIKGEYDRNKILQKYGVEYNGKKIILYAPTWKWGGGSLGECFEYFATRIPEEYIFIVRPHTNDWDNIKYIKRWQKKNRIKDLYIFSKQYHNIMELIHIADLMIGDNSAVNYDFAITGKPMVLVDSPSEDLFTPPDEYNIRLCAPIFKYGRDDILRLIEKAFTSNSYRKCLKELVKRSFYFNDGHAVDRACSFIVDHLDEMGVIDKGEALKVYGDKFQYTNSYKN